MASEKGLMSGLIQKLEYVEIKLKGVQEEEGMEFTLPHDKHRSFTQMKNILETLVKKIVDGKSDDDDISLISELPFHTKQLVFKNLISSEEYLEEAKKVVLTTIKPDSILNLLFNFLELLGDILHSVCEINNHKMKVPSRITVKDLIQINNQYVSLWNLISTNTRDNSSNKIHNNSFKAQFERKLIELQKYIHLCLKEMSKVKLEIEHYFKCNSFELQLTASFNDLINTEEGKVNENLTKHSQKKAYLFLEENYNDTRNMSFNTSVHFNREHKCKPPSTLFPKSSSEPSDSIETRQYDFILDPKTTTIPNVKNEFDENLFSNSFVYSHDYLLFDPATMFTVPIKPTQKNSLPKIYSVDSVSEHINPNTPKTYKQEKLINTTNNVKEIYNGQIRNGKLDNETTFQGKLPVESSMEEDLFKDDINIELSDSQSVELNKKISSLLDMLKEQKRNINDNMFEADKLHIEGCNLSFSESINNQSQIHKPFLNVENGNKNVEKSPNFPSKPLHQITNKITTQQNENDDKFILPPIHHNKININYPYKIPSEEDIIYDQRSLIELFRTTKENNCSNSESYSQQGNCCMWPVAAEYIYTSKHQGSSYMCQSISSDNSFPLATSFEKSFFSLHLNKRYEQNQKYDGDLIVLESPTKFKNDFKSSNSIMHPSNVIFDVDQHKVKEREYYNQNSKRSTKPFYPQNGAFSKLKTTIDTQKTLAVQYTNCTSPYLSDNNSFRRDNFDFLKINGYDNNNNWNSFISIFTSKVGPNTRINQHRMFRKIINNIGNETLSVDNMVGNVHTLTSNGGPFRLFDLNGYPLTDCSGNVLKDPYGKAVVELDSTGFPKDDIKVYDAAGNSPNDVNFDPTQKPKTNTIIIKLTDNFKRPLHLFDKYGRPLTDFNGKLLVNIHGRPLLRFDNFGRPNTDYRGGPLYTDNGFRWSYNYSESYSNEKLSNEHLMSRKLTDKNRNAHMDESCLPMNTVSSQFSALNGDLENREVKELQKDKLLPIINSTRSDIWVTVESVLQRMPKKKKPTEAKSSQTSVIINNVTVTHGSIEKGLLKPIIYHNNFIQDQNNTNFSFSNNETNCYSVNQLKHLLKDNTLLRSDKTDYVPNDRLLKEAPTVNDQFPFYNNILIHNTCSKCFQPKQKDICNRPIFDCIATDTVYEKNKTNFDYKLLLKPSIFLRKKELMTNVSKEDLFKRTSINLNSNNQNYLDKLCNQILKYQIDKKTRSKQYVAEVAITNRKWTETSHSNIISSTLSKNTSEPPNIRESHELTIGAAQKRTTCNYCYDCKQQTQLKTSFQKCNPSFIEKVKHFPDYFRNKGLTTKQSESITRISDKCLKENSLLTSEEETLSINLCNQDKKSFRTNVIEKSTQVLEPNIYGSSLDNNFSSKNSIVVLKRKEAKAKDIRSKLKHTQKINCNKSSNIKNYNKQTKDSPFRFPSENKLRNSYYTDELNYDHSGNIDLSSSNNFKTDPSYIKRDFKTQYINDTKTIKNKKNNIFCERTPLEECGIKIKRKEINSLKNIADTKTECNIVSFLGSPVKYVLNKLDSKRLPKPQTNFIRKSMLPTTLYQRDNKEISTNSIYGETKNNISEEPKLKTLYFSESGKNKNSTTTVEKLKKKKKLRNRSLLKHRGELIAYQSKSCDNIMSNQNYAPMSYSGNEKYSTESQRNSNSMIRNSFEIRKYSSVTHFMKGKKLENNFKHVYKPEKSKNKTKNVGLQTCNSRTIRKKHTIPYYDGSDNKSKNKKVTTKKYLKSTALPKNKKKEFIFFKKL